MHCLDNPIWNALTTRQSHLALGDEYGRRYPREISPLAGLSEFTPEGFASLAKLCGESDLVAICFPGDLRIPDTWNTIRELPCLQMICEKLVMVPALNYEVLTIADVPAMKALVKLTEPGPFSDRTIELGRYIGIKDGGRLVAMAGERMKISDPDTHYDEVSAVCTHPDYRGRGYAKVLTYLVAKNIVEQAHTPILHVRSDNTAAIRAYEALGFAKSREFMFAAVAPPN